MAKYVLLSFENDKEADAFVDAVNVTDRDLIHGDKPRVIFMRNEVQDGQIYGGFEHEVFVRGVYKKPTKFCECELSGKAQRDGFTRGKTFGWWVHPKCGKPKKQWAEGDAWYTALGKNLLPTSPQAPEWRGEGVRGHKWDEEKKAWVNVETGKVWKQ